MNPKVNAYIENLDTWQKELVLLRKIALECGLDEDYKWMHPCYTLQNKNVLILQEFKNYCAIMFCKGALLKDNRNFLVKITENVQAERQLRFTDLSRITQIEPVIKEYIFEAIEIEKAGLSVPKKKTSDYNIPVELEEKFRLNRDFKSSFHRLTPGRQRGYLLHFYQAKQSGTRIARIEKNMDRIMQGFGLTDCTCGLSRRKPNCDGSHKQLAVK